MSKYEDIVEKVRGGAALSSGEGKYLVKELCKVKGESPPDLGGGDNILDEVFVRIKKAIQIFDSSKGNAGTRQQAVAMVQEALGLLEG